MHFTYRTKGTCSREILFDVDGKTVKNIEFIGGCNGNLQGISKLVEGMDIDTLYQWLLDNRLHLCHWFTVSDLMYLKRGGRVSPTVALVGGCTFLLCLLALSLSAAAYKKRRQKLDEGEGSEE